MRCYDGFFVQIFISASPLVLSELSQNAPLVADTLHTAGSYPFSERTLRTIVYIAGGDSLILSRCFVTEAPPSRSELIQGIMRRFPDLAMENIGLAEVHPSMHTINPVAHRSKFQMEKKSLLQLLRHLKFALFCWGADAQTSKALATDICHPCKQGKFRRFQMIVF